jgi:hypothetical protein
MAQSLANTFRDTAAIAARTAEETNPDANWTNGMNNSACMPGIGVAFGQPNAEGSDEQFTLLDQDGDARVPQVSQLLGGTGFVDREAGTSVPDTSSGGVEGNGKAQVEYIIAAGNPTQAAKDGDPALEGTITVLGTANLQTLAVGWTNTPI